MNSAATPVTTTPARTTRPNQNLFTNVEGVSNPALSTFPQDGGFGGFAFQSPPSPIGDCTFNVPPIIEAADSGPFFHTDTQVAGAPSENTDSAQTIEQAVAFYNSNAFQLVDFNATDIANVGRFLRALNAVFNIQMASNRIIGARNMGNALGNVARVDRMQRRMAQMTLFELDDAVRVLSQVNLNPAQADRVRTARTRIETVVATSGTSRDGVQHSHVEPGQRLQRSGSGGHRDQREHHLQHRQRDANGLRRPLDRRAARHRALLQPGAAHRRSVAST